MIPRASVRGAVLAGGDSTRFAGGGKALADLNGRPMLDRVLTPVGAATDGSPVLAVASDVEGERLAGAVDTPVETVVDVPEPAGPVAGLLAAAAATDHEWLFVCGCDMPLVAAAGVDALRRAADSDRFREAADSDPTDGLDAVVPTVEGFPQPLHALYRREAVLAVSESVPETGGPMALLDVLEAVRHVPAEALDAPLAAAVTNVNTRADFEGVADRLRDR